MLDAIFNGIQSVAAVIVSAVSYLDSSLLTDVNFGGLYPEQEILLFIEPALTLTVSVLEQSTESTSLMLYLLGGQDIEPFNWSDLFINAHVPAENLVDIANLGGLHLAPEAMLFVEPLLPLLEQSVQSAEQSIQSSLFTFAPQSNDISHNSSDLLFNAHVVYNTDVANFAPDWNNVIQGELSGIGPALQDELSPETCKDLHNDCLALKDLSPNNIRAFGEVSSESGDAGTAGPANDYVCEDKKGKR
jgi:hypothetical protein